MDNFDNVKTLLAVVVAMRWDVLFDDLADTFDGLALDIQPTGDIASGEKGDTDPLDLTLRRAAATARPVELVFPAGVSEQVTVRGVGVDWLSTAPAHASAEALLVPLGAIDHVLADGLDGATPAPRREVRLVEVLHLWHRRAQPLIIRTMARDVAGTLNAVGNHSIAMTIRRGESHCVIPLDAIITVSSGRTERWVEE